MKENIYFETHLTIGNMKLLIVFLVTSLFIACAKQQEFSEETTSEGSEEGESDEDEGLPSSDANLVAFYLYPNPENVTYAEEIRIGCGDTLKSSGYSSSKKAVLVVHGFVNNYTTRYSQRMKNAFLEGGFGRDYNVILVDWGALASPKNQTNLGVTPLNNLAKNPFYQKAVKNVPVVGRRIAEFIDFLMIEKYLESPNDVYLIGFSLGAQVSGSAGYEVRQNMSAPIGRITGLDPAGPLFQTQPNKALKLDASDASFVDVIHTNQGQSGYEGDIGHADFYPNGGGPNQNDCLGVGVDEIQSNVAGVCAHNRCWVYYILSMFHQIYACKCVATPDYICKATCPNKVLFGYPTPHTARGTFYVDVNGKGQECVTQNCVQGDAEMTTVKASFSVL